MEYAKNPSIDEVSVESARLGAIIENHIDDMTFVMREIGILDNDEMPGVFWKSGCRIDRAKVAEAIADIARLAVLNIQKAYDIGLQKGRDSVFLDVNKQA